MKRSWLIIPYTAVLIAAAWSQNIRGYQKYFAQIKTTDGSPTRVALRKFSSRNQVNYLVLDPGDLSTAILNDNRLIVTAGQWEDILKRFDKTPYVSALHEAMQNADAIQDAGITRFSALEQGASLTIDLCPSAKPLDRQLFIDLINVFGAEEKTVPVAISISDHPAAGW